MEKDDVYQDMNPAGERNKDAPGPKDLVSGIFPGQKASGVGGGSGLLGPNGTPMELPKRFNSKEKMELRAQQERMKAAQFKFHIEAFTQFCDDKRVRMMFRVINESIGSKKKTVLLEYGYSKEQLAEFTQSIEDHESDIQKAQLESEGPEDPPPAQDESTPGELL